jgi:hypothetical protein
MTAHSHTVDAAAGERRSYGHATERNVLWVLLILNLAWFTPFAVSTGSGIMQALMRSPAWTEGAQGASGAGYLLMDVVGVLVLGLAIAWGLLRYQTRNRALDPLTEAATREEYEHPDAPPLRS